MSQAQLSLLFTVFGTSLVYYAVNSWLVSQGGNGLFGLNLVSHGKVPVALVAILICAVLSIAMSAVGILHARRQPGKWHRRIPFVGFTEFDTGSPEGKVYQFVVLVLFSLLPLIALVHFWDLVEDAAVYDHAKDLRLPEGALWDFGYLGSLNDPARICTNFNPDVLFGSKCSGNATILPGLEPFTFLVLTAGALLLALLHWREIFRSRSVRVKPWLTG